MEVNRVHLPPQPSGVKKADAGGLHEGEGFLAHLGPLTANPNGNRKKKDSGRNMAGPNTPKTGPLYGPAPVAALYPDEDQLEASHPGLTLDKRA